MEIVFSDHAKDQIKRRKISTKLVNKAVRIPDETSSGFRDRKLHRLHVGGRILEVVTIIEELKVIIITAYYLKEK